MKRTFSTVTIASRPKPDAGSSPRPHYPGISSILHSCGEIGNDGVEQRKAGGRDAQPSGAVDLDQILGA
jgi:hypothetical protein